jgi:hypothetical protein
MGGWETKSPTPFPQSSCFWGERIMTLTSQVTQEGRHRWDYPYHLLGIISWFLGSGGGRLAQKWNRGLWKLLSLPQVRTWCFQYHMFPKLCWQKQWLSWEGSKVIQCSLGYSLQPLGIFLMKVQSLWEKSASGRQWTEMYTIPAPSPRTLWNL